MESSFSLRLALLIAGAAVIALVYFFGTRRSRNRNRLRKQGRVSRINPVDVISAHQSAEQKSGMLTDELDAESVPQDSPVIGANDPVVDQTAAYDDLPKLEKEPAARRGRRKSRAAKNITQMEMRFDEESAQPPDAAQTDRLITLYVMPPTEHAFAGESIVQALNSVGLHYGDMEIFHHFGAGRLRTKEPLFSVANMLEPGTFEISNMHRFQSPGLVFFLQLPALLDGAVSFELFLNTAQRLTEALNGELYADPKTPLDSLIIENMRKLAAEY